LQPSFLQRYLAAFHRIEGWFQFDAALMFMAYHQLLAEHGIAANVLEIGVHHGLSTIAIAALRAPGAQLYAVDLFEKLQSQNVSGSGAGNRAIFERNMREFFGNIDFIVPITGASGSLDRSSFQGDFSFCHVDGGHSRAETFHDLDLAVSLLVPGGLVALDDYFNPEFPGVCEGAVELLVRKPGVLAPVALAYNKVLFQKQPAPFDLNVAFWRAFPRIPHKIVEMWSSPAVLFADIFRSYFDLYASTPDCLKAMGAAGARAVLASAKPRTQARPGSSITLPVEVSNVSNEAFPAGDRVFGLSYHLLSVDGKLLQHDNDRSYLTTVLQPGAKATIPLKVQAPREAGIYKLELDLVWEQVMWFKDVGNPVPIVELEVS
jgi:Methyltransferase domain